MTTEILPRVDLVFRLAGRLVPLDHGHALLGALGGVLGDLHDARWLAVHPISGLPRPDGLLALHARKSFLRLRVEPAHIPRALGLAGKSMMIDGHPVHIGVSSVFALEPRRTLTSRLVTIKGFLEPEPFRDALKRQMDALGVVGRAEVGRRRVMKVRGDVVVGFGVTLHELDAEGSLRVQYEGFGGKHRMGAGVFVPVGREQ